MSEDNELLEVSEESFDFDPNLPDSFVIEIADLRDREDVEYPALLLSNVLFMDCLRVLKANNRKSYRSVDTWVELSDNNEFQHIGELPLSSDTLLALRHLRIRATLYVDAETVEVLDLESPEVIEKFI